jgi:hypothetical protein
MGATPEGLGIALKTVEKFAERVSQLYEQGAGENRIEEYVRRWWRWVRSGVGLLLRVGCCPLGRVAMLRNIQTSSSDVPSFFVGLGALTKCLSHQVWRVFC